MAQVRVLIYTIVLRSYRCGNEQVSSAKDVGEVWFGHNVTCESQFRRPRSVTTATGV
jgi:hypothetical protein